MGYDLHVTRATDWSANVGREISVEEWIALVEADPELKPDPEHGPYAVSWEHPRRQGSGWFDWSDGNVYTTDPDRATVRKMLTIAERLIALVQGDDGVVFDSLEDWTDRH